MPVRTPVVANQFYPGDPGQLARAVDSFLFDPADGRAPDPVWGVMLPHAGYIYCAKIIGETLSGVALPKTLVVLCPNHTGMGQAFGVWPDGGWDTPLGRVKVAEELAAALTGAGCGFAPDIHSHLREHSIEVLLPFLQRTTSPLEIVPVCVGTQDVAALRWAGEGLGRVLREWRGQGREVGIVVSSDMNHYENHQRTLQKDDKALVMIVACDPEGLLEVVGRESITMCGAAPMAMALFAARTLGTPVAQFVGHDTSATASGDATRVVGYAGVRLRMATV
ncbi:MAG: AmmeMemoRadiSam system protein B [Desulfovibrio sp.]|jgi:AmmeMemoRadiSam system protein B|nr:AmmeMemoRadiSam system protein B [Desulfovibrio sp.]